MTNLRLSLSWLNVSDCFLHRLPPFLTHMAAPCLPSSSYFFNLRKQAQVFPASELSFNLFFLSASDLTLKISWMAYIHVLSARQSKVLIGCFSVLLHYSVELSKMSSKAHSSNNINHARRTVQQLRVEASFERIKVQCNSESWSLSCSAKSNILWVHYDAPTSSTW